jgi:signal transduction histidine kinase
VTLPSDRSGLSVPRQPPTYVDLQSASGEEVSGASRRLRALAALSGSLTDALSPEDAAVLVEREALSALGATTAVVVTLGAFPAMGVSAVDGPIENDVTTLHVVHAIGLPAELSAALDRLPLAAPVPFAEVARTGQPRFLGSEQELRTYLDWGAAMCHAGARAAAIVPVWANGELRGVLGLSWAAPRVFDEDERAFVLTLGVMCAQAIMRAYLRAAERSAREGADDAREGADLARAVAEQANQSKAHFVATISHELRTPMQAILGYTALVVDEICGPINPVQKTHLSRVRDSGAHLLGLVEDLLRYAQIEAGHEVVNAETVGLSNIVEQTLVLVRPLAEKKGLRIRVEAPAGGVDLYTDPLKLKQVLINLLANAVKFTDTGEIVLSLRVEGQGVEMGVFFEITDTGRGIAVEDREHIFDPFWQVEPRSKHTKGSGGLGLSVGRQLARLLGGDVTITNSVIGKGSTFVVSLPALYRCGARPLLLGGVASS